MRSRNGRTLYRMTRRNGKVTVADMRRLIMLESQFETCGEVIAYEMWLSGPLLGLPGLEGS